MSLVNAPEYVRQQYATSANLDARLALHQRYSAASENFHEWLFQQICLAANANILEVGCGSGTLWDRTSARIPQAWRITLTDLSFGMVSAVQAKLPAAQFRFAAAAATALPFPDSTFDGIFANHMLYHVPNLQNTLHELRRVLRPGGTLYAATNGATHLRELDELAADIQAKSIPEAHHYIDAFGLENGAGSLAPYFAHIERRDFPDALEVTDVEPLVAYIRSGALFDTIAQNPTYLAEFRRRVQSAIDTRGAFYITKSVGLFVASR